MCKRPIWTASCVLLLVFSSASVSAQQSTRICVHVEVRSWGELSTERASSNEPAEGVQGPRGEQGAGLPLGGAFGAQDGPVDEPQTRAQSAQGAEDATEDEWDETLPVRWPSGEESSSAEPSPAPAPSAAPPAPTTTPHAAPAPETPAPQAPRFVFDPAIYLRRLVEHQVTHRSGFEAVSERCGEDIWIELYPLETGYTVFGRYSGHAREEKVDRVEIDELSALAERLVVALLEDRSILATLTRTTVLRSDSEGELRRIRGGRDFLFGLGSWMQLGRLPTAPGTIDPATDQWRLSAPLGVSMGSRFVYRAWGLDAYASMLFGTSQLAARSNPGGGHADYSFGLGTGLRFFRYLAPASAQSFYVGGGASFQLSRYRVLSGEPHGRAEGLWGGGMYLDAVLGAEFLRASAMRFFVEATLGAPTYRFQSENDNGRIDAFILSGTVQIGLLL